MDLFPTICELAGVEIDRSRSTAVAPADLAGPGATPCRKTLCSGSAARGAARYLGQDYYAARRGPWKLVQNHPFEPYQLYNLDDDPLEERDRATTERGIARELVHDLQRQLQRAGEVPWQPPSR